MVEFLILVISFIFIFILICQGLFEEFIPFDVYSSYFAMLNWLALINHIFFFSKAN